MNRKKKPGRVKWTLTGTIILVLGCGLFQIPNTAPTQTATPTYTPESGDALLTPASTTSRCEGLSGTLEMQVLAGPAEAVGLEPFAVGEIPFSVVRDGNIYTIQGNGTIAYQQVLEKEWGTYSVTLDMTPIVSGECSGTVGSETLHMIVEASGEQMVEVKAEGFSGDYPWSGTHQLELTFLLEEGASAEGEGWAFILHLNE